MEQVREKTVTAGITVDLGNRGTAIYATQISEPTLTLALYSSPLIRNDKRKQREKEERKELDAPYAPNLKSRIDFFLHPVYGGYTFQTGHFRILWDQVDVFGLAPITDIPGKIFDCERSLPFHTLYH